MRIAICPQSHLLRVAWPAGLRAERLAVRCPQCDRDVVVRAVDGRMLSQEGLAEAWQHRSG